MRNYNKLQTKYKRSEWKDMLLKAPKTRRCVFQDRSRADEELTSLEFVFADTHAQG